MQHRAAVLHGLSNMQRNANINIVLVQPEIPHNTGAVGRLCVGLGARLHLVRPLGFRIDDASLKRCGLDYWEHVDLKVHDCWDKFLESEAPGRAIFLTKRATKSLYDYRFRPGAYLVFGSEHKGFPPDFYETYSDKLYSIPMPGKHARSINLANAAAIAAYEAFRQISDGS